MENNKFFENENFENNTEMEDAEMYKNEKIERGLATALNIVTTICNVVIVVGGAVEGAQKISTARDNLATAKNIAQTQRIKSEVNKTKALHRQRRIENLFNRKG